MRTLIAFLLVTLFLYGGLVLVESGVSDIQGSEPSYEALKFSFGDNKFYIIFGGEEYQIDLEKIGASFEQLLSKIKTLLEV